MKSMIVLPLLLVWTSPAFAADQVLGLLSLPQVFGSGPCDDFVPQDVTLYAAPESNEVVGSIRVDRHWTFPAGGGCDGLTVNAHREKAVSALPTREHEYEAPAAIVFCSSAAGGSKCA